MILPKTGEFFHPLWLPSQFAFAGLDLDAQVFQPTLRICELNEKVSKIWRRISLSRSSGLMDRHHDFAKYKARMYKYDSLLVKMNGHLSLDQTTRNCFFRLNLSRNARTFCRSSTISPSSTVRLSLASSIARIAVLRSAWTFSNCSRSFLTSS